MNTQLYSAPVRVNGEDTFYSFMVGESLRSHRKKILYTMLGGLLDENGLPARATGSLKKGDRVAIYAAKDEAGMKLSLQEEFTIEDDDILPAPIPLPEGRYRCQYIVTDIIGRTAGSDYCIYEITGKDEERQIDLKEIEKNE